MASNTVLSALIAVAFARAALGSDSELSGTIAAESLRGSKGHAGYTGQKLRKERDSDDDDSRTYVFLQKFPLVGTGGLIFHTEVLVCPRDSFSSDDQNMLDETVASLEDFAEMDGSWWTDRTATCVELGYGGAECGEECCGVPHGPGEQSYPLNARRAVISNADTSDKTLYLYGVGPFGGEAAYHHACDHKCWSNWSGTDYNPLTNNCNTFTSTVLKCVYGMSEKKPHLGPSDMVTVKCKCSLTPAESNGGASSFQWRVAQNSVGTRK